MADTDIGERTGARRQRSGLQRRRRALILVLLGSVVLTGAGVITASVIKSPAQAAADTRPPPATVLTAAVEKKILSETVITRGKVATSQQISVSGEGAGGKDAGRSVVTKVFVKAGKPLRSGQALLEVSGRPIFVLKGDIPAYRDLGPGSTGEDVSQLRQALRELGYASDVDPAGTFGPGTERAVTLFYQARGYEPGTERRAPDAGPGNASADGQSTGDAPEEPSEPASRVVVPVAEIAYVRAEPAFVESVSAQVGDQGSGELATVSAGDLIVNGSVDADVRKLMKPGQKVSIVSEVTGDKATGTVESVADRPTKQGKNAESTPQAGGDTYRVKVKPSRPLPTSLAGEDVRITVTAASSGKAVMAVPTSAISTGENGQATVMVRQGARERRVVVDTGMTADGYVEVTARDAKDLAVGDRVIVGVDASGAAGAG
ncbi:peptidoglycan-binding protein [Streptomyces sp. CS014]|uniref:peptidoglycan-binding protein n=1 Tax=Streptomyces sp. CS014 TaxID=2162707 RepID=UPI000D51E768|nr:peptidoglycan-binding protein [Streptomyces sp. CS014]PVC94031.1 peptidoglycan-binding protein [Streptomyces sp. CS014]